MTRFESATTKAQPMTGRREVRADMTITTAVIIPALQALLPAAALGVVVVIIASIAGIEAGVGVLVGIASVLSGFGVGFMLLRPDANTQRIAEWEERTGVDLDGDGVVGAPEPADTEHQFVYVNTGALGKSERIYRKQAQLVRDMIQRGTAYKDVVGRYYGATGEQITRREWEQMRDLLLRSQCAHEDNSGKLVMDLGHDDVLKTLGIPEKYWR